MPTIYSWERRWIELSANKAAAEPFHQLENSGYIVANEWIGELAIQRLLKSWAANSYRVAGFNDTLFSLRPDTMARRLYGPDWQHVAFQAAREADNA